MLIFDLDGTLCETLEDANLIAKEYVEVGNFHCKSGMRLSFEDNAKNYMPYLSKEKAKYYLQLISEKNIELINSKGAKLYDGVIDTIISLSKKYKLGIITNNNDDYVISFFKTSNLQDYFTDYIGAASYNIT